MGAGQRATEAPAELQERVRSSVLLGISLLHRPSIWPNPKISCDHKPVVAMAFICQRQVASTGGRATEEAHYQTQVE